MKICAKCTTIFFPKSLDKPPPLWYNKYVINEREEKAMYDLWVLVVIWCWIILAIAIVMNA